MSWTKPDDTPDVVYEFFAPFAHVPGKYEWCRIRSPTHGVFDTFILLDAIGTHRPATVYVRDEAGRRFMADRYPECTTVQVPADAMTIHESRDGRMVRGRLEAGEAGPLRRAEMTLNARPNATPQALSYGGQGLPVWGGRWTCWGVDLVLEARADGVVEFRDGRRDELQKAPALLTLGSFGRIAPLARPG